MSLRDRAEALLEEVGVEGSGKLADDVRAVADALSVPFTTVGETVAACERETTSTVLGTVTPRESLSGNALEAAQSALAAAAPMPAAPEVKSEPTSLNFGLPSNGPGAAIFWDLAGGSPSAPTAAEELRSMVAALYPGANTCKAFVDFSALPPATRVQLRNSGVELVDTSGSTSDGSPVVVDLFDHALGAASEKDRVLVVVLAGAPKGQFGRAFASLARHGYKVALVRPRNSVAVRFDSACFASHDFGGATERTFETIPLCFKCGWRNCARSHPRRCATMVICAFCGQTNHDTRYHNDFQAYVKGRAAEQAQAQAQAAAAHGLPPPQYSAPRLQAIPFQPPITLQPQVSATPCPAFVPKAVPVRTSSNATSATTASNFSMSGSAFDLSAGASLWTPADAAAPAPSLLEPRDVVPPRTSAIIDAHLARLGEASGGGTFGIEAGALGPPPPARSLSASYPAQSPPFSPAPTPPRSPIRSPIPFAPVCPPPPRAPSPAPAPLALEGLSLGGRPPGLDARSRAPSESTLTEISESLSDALR